MGGHVEGGDAENKEYVLVECWSKVDLSFLNFFVLTLWRHTAILLSSFHFFVFLSFFGVPELRIKVSAAPQKPYVLPQGYATTLLGYSATLPG